MTSASGTHHTLHDLVDWTPRHRGDPSRPVSPDQRNIAFVPFETGTDGEPQQVRGPNLAASLLPHLTAEGVQETLVGLGATGGELPALPVSGHQHHTVAGEAHCRTSMVDRKSVV